MNKSVIIINGPATSGKDTFCDMYVEHLYNHNIKGKSLSSVDNVKMAASLLGWNGKKDTNSRNALSELKAISEGNWNGTSKYLLDYVKNSDVVVTFMHIREIDSINKMITLCKEQGYNVRTLFINRDVKQLATNKSDLNARDINYNYQDVINNNGTIVDLQNEVTKYFNLNKEVSAPQLKSELNITNDYDELVKIVGSAQIIDENIARFAGGVSMDTGNDFLTLPYWTFDDSNGVNHGTHADIGSFGYKTSWDSLISIIRLSKYDGIIDLYDITKTYKLVALHIHNTQEVPNIEINHK